MRNMTLFRFPLAVVAIIATVMTCSCTPGGSGSDEGTISSLPSGLECIAEGGNVGVVNADGSITNCGKIEDAYGCMNNKCTWDPMVYNVSETEKAATGGMVSSALIVGGGNVDPYMSARGPCVPVGFLKCGSIEDFLPDGTPFNTPRDRWYCMIEFMDEFNFAHTKAVPMLCGEFEECKDNGPYPAVGVCYPILDCQNDTDCDDGDVCTDDTCVAGKCQIVAAPGKSCDDNIACTKGDTCRTKGDTDPSLECRGDALVCEDRNPCTTDSCDTATGECLYTNLANDPATACDDTLPCTVNDKCFDGACVGTDKVCDDGKQCTDDACDLTSGECLFTNKENTVACDDANACTLQDQCADGACVGTPTTACDDENPCTTDSCDPLTGICAHTTVDDGTDCGPQNAKCVTGECVPGGQWCLSGAADECCTEPVATGHMTGVCQCLVEGESAYGVFSIKTQCGLVENQAYCQNNAQGIPTCGTTCVPNCTAKVCGDNGCGGSCGTCSTGLLCNTTGQCHECLGALDCDDVNACTNDTCDIAGVCQYQNVTDGTSCGTEMVCSSGTCVAVPPPTPECTKNEDCGASRVCFLEKCYSDLKGDVWPGVSGAFGGPGPDGTPDIVDNDGDCYAEGVWSGTSLVPGVVYTSLNPYCATVLPGDCDDDPLDGWGGQSRACDTGTALVFVSATAECPTGTTFKFLTDGSIGNNPAVSEVTDSLDNNCDGTWQ